MHLKVLNFFLEAELNKNNKGKLSKRHAVQTFQVGFNYKTNIAKCPPTGHIIVKYNYLCTTDNENKKFNLNFH